MTTATDNLRRDSLYIAGAWTQPTGSETIEVVEPATGEVMGYVPRGTIADVDAAVSAARTAFETWSQTTPQERATWASRIADAIEERADPLAVLMARELGMPVDQCKTIQVRLGIADFRNAGAGIEEIVWEEELGNSRIFRVPVGVVGAITPWNYPLHQITAKVAAAVSAGCTVVLKPSEVTPLTAYAFAEVLDEIDFPAGVFNLIPGFGTDVGEALVGHPGVDVVSFTGSTGAGRRISEIAAASVKPVTMELGGKSASVVLEDADLERAIEVTFTKAYQNSGQTCSALTRLLVPRGQLERAEQIARRVAETYITGDPFAPESKLGPLVSEAQLNRVQSYIKRGVEEGAKLLTGGAERPVDLDAGYYVRPTVFSEVNSGMVIAQEEIFGPVLCILPYDDEDDAVRIANDSDYGLAGAVWSADANRAVQAGRRIRTGQISINGGLYNTAAPFGGFKQSGHGRESGKYGIEEFLTYTSFQF
ncbi:aldehyde dehydrogenase family protein [Mycolicibacterium setense]